MSKMLICKDAGNILRIKNIILVTCFIALMFAALTLLAQEKTTTDNVSLIHQLKFGVLAHDVGDLWSGFNREEGVDLNFEVTFGPSYAILGGVLRPAIGGTINTAGDTSKGYIDALWQYDFASKIFLIIGLGAAIHNGETNFISNKQKALGSRVLFHVPLEVGYHVTSQTTISVYFDHISNAGTAKENEGLDTIGVRFGYIF